MMPSKIIRSKRKTLSISINDNAELIVRAPHRLPIEKIQSFIDEKEKWINKHRNIVDSRKRENAHDQDMLMYLGSLFPIRIMIESSSKLTFNGDTFITNCNDKETHKKSIRKWYKNKFREVAIPRLSYFAEKHNLKVNQVRIKEQKTMWGSCSSRNNINLNYLLIMAPMKVIDYVIIHELAHTIHRNHSSHFWKTVETMMPNFKEAKKWLKDYGYKLRKL